MRKIELKRIADFIRGTRPPEEKPLSTTSFVSHGTITKGPMGACNDTSSCGQQLTSSSDDDSSEKPKMTLTRKICFVLSLQGGVLYVLFFAWWLPCREPFCDTLKRDWRMSLGSAELTTNLEMSDSSNLASIIFGYSQEGKHVLASYYSRNGSMQWNTTGNDVFRHVFCNFEHVLDCNSDSKADGIFTAYEQVAAFDVGSGSILWRTTLNPAKKTVHKVVLVGDPSSGGGILGVSDSYLHLLDPRNGTQLWAAPLPCSLTVDIKLVGSWKTKNGTVWALVCDYGDKLEVWTTTEEELLSPPRSSESIRTDLPFSSLFSKESTTGSIDLASDVTRSREHLAVSWANMVVMATTQGPSHNLEFSWNTQFEDSFGIPILARSVVFGHFTERFGETELAVALQNNDSESRIAILSSRNGVSKFSFQNINKTVLRMEKIVGRPENNELDSIVAESVDESDAKKSLSDSTTRYYFLAQYERNNKNGNGSLAFTDIISANGVHDSSLSPVAKGVSQLVLGMTYSGETHVSRHVIATREAESLCHQQIHLKNITQVWLVDGQ